MKKEKKIKEVEESSEHEYVEQSDGVKDPVIQRNQPIETFTYKDEHLQKIEDSRKQFHGVYKKQSGFRWVISLGALVLVILAWILIPSLAKDQSFTLPLTIGVIAFVLAGVLTYSILTKRSLNKKMREYFKVFYEESNAFALNGKGISNVEYQNPDKISMDQFTDNIMYKNIVEVGSRGLTAFEYNKTPIMICDCAGQIKTEKRIAPVFVGKYLFAASNYENENPIIIYIKGDERKLPPTNIDDMKVVSDDDRMTIYSNNKKWSSTIDANVKKILGEVKLSKDLVDLAISLTPGRCFVCMGYDDPLMVLPLERPYNPKPITVFKKDLDTILKLIEAFNK